jgi:4-amino-4-deoxy-L-arabinose transferase-like glycosyltransferase
LDSCARIAILARMKISYTALDKGSIKALLLLVCALACVFLFYDNALQYMRHRLQYGLYLYRVAESEMVFFLWYVVFGGAFIGFLVAGLNHWRGTRHRFETWVCSLLDARLLPFVAFSLVLCGALFVRNVIVLNAPIADDEETYRFIAATLLRGAVLNPLPPDPDFYWQNLSVMNDRGWFGVYPIGFPALLAIGMFLHLEFMVVPLITAVTAWFLWLIAVEIGGHRLGGLTCLLLLLSPQFIFMGASLHSQPATMMAMAGGTLAALRYVKRQSPICALLSGFAFGYGVLIRPAPGVLFVAVAGLWILLAIQNTSMLRRFGTSLLFAIPVILFGLVLLAVNQAQSGDPLLSGYHEFYRTTHIRLFQFHNGVASSSLFGGLLRLNFWLLGWPLSFLFLPFALPRHWRQPITLLWGLVGASLFYRIMSPKTVVATLGPVYLTEIVPVLVLLTALAMVRLRDSAAGGFALWLRDRTPQIVVAGTLASALFFLPVQSTSIRRSATLWNEPLRQLEASISGDALIFSRYMVDVWRGVSWAYYPPHSGVDPNARFLFVRPSVEENWHDHMVEFWQTRYPEREAFLLVHRDGEPRSFHVPLHFSDLINRHAKAALSATASTKAGRQG